MNIFGQGLSTRNNWEPQGGRHTTDASKTAGGSHASAVSSASSAGSEAVPSLQSGQVFRGEILNITSGDVTILLDNQQTINAKLGEAIELNIGQRMYFEVKENQGDQVFIRPLPDMNLDGQAMAAEKALSANGFSFTERNLLIANSLMEAGMPLNKESMRKIMQQQARFPEADIKQLVAMNRLELPVNEMTVKQFAQYSSHEHQLTQAMNHVLDGLEAALGNVAAEGDIEQLQNMNRQIMDIFGWNGKGEAVKEIVEHGTQNPGTDMEGNADKTGTLDTNPDRNGNTPVNSGINGKVPEGGGRNPAFAVNEPAGRDTAGSDAEKGTITERGRTEGTQAEALTASKNSSVGSTSKADSLLEGLRMQLKGLGIPEETVQRLTEGTQGHGELLSNISHYLMQEGVVTPQGLRSFFQSENYRQMLKKGIQEEWLMKPESMKEPREIDRLYEKIQNQSEQLEQSFSQSGHSNQEFAEHSQNMRDNIQFMQQLNQQFIFAQLPMRMNGTEANSELFVYANKKKLQQGAEGLKLLLHLDMPNLGSTDILVRLKDHMLHARFTLEDQTSVTIIAENMQALSEKLEEKGFHFTNEVQKVEPKQEENSPSGGVQPDAVVEEMLNQDLVTGMKRYTFDMRT